MVSPERSNWSISRVETSGGRSSLVVLFALEEEEVLEYIVGYRAEGGRTSRKKVCSPPSPGGVISSLSSDEGKGMSSSAVGNAVEKEKREKEKREKERRRKRACRAGTCIETIFNLFFFSRGSPAI